MEEVYTFKAFKKYIGFGYWYRNSRNKSSFDRGCSFLSFLIFWPIAYPVYILMSFIGQRVK